MEGRRRITLLEHLAGGDGGRQTLEGLLTLDGVVGAQKSEPAVEPPRQQPPTASPAPPVTPLLCTRTLVETIGDEDGSERGINSWKALKDRLGLIQVFNSNSSRRNTTEWNNSVSEYPPSAGDDDTAENGIQIGSNRFLETRPESSRYGNSFGPDASVVGDLPATSSHPHSSRQLASPEPQNQKSEIHSIRRGVAGEGDEENDAPPDSSRISRISISEDRTPFREAATSRETAEPDPSKDAIGGGMKMPLMAWLEEEGSSYTMGEEDFDCEEEEEGGEEDGEKEAEASEKKEAEDDSGSIDCHCCICMVRRKGAAFIPCGHAFCRLCSRELYEKRRNCPVCNQVIADILDIF